MYQIIVYCIIPLTKPVASKSLDKNESMRVYACQNASEFSSNLKDVCMEKAISCFCRYIVLLSHLSISPIAFQIGLLTS